MFLLAHVSTPLHFAMDQSIQLAPGFVVWRDDQRALRLSRIRARDFAEPFFASRDLTYAALLVKIEYCSAHVTGSELFHDFLERRILLPHDLIQACSLHSRLL